MNAYDAIVFGTGGVGSAALFHVARRGVRVLGLDSFPPGHDRGSSHGSTRIIREAYFEHPDYVPLAQRAFDLWAELESLSGTVLYRQTGLLQIGPPKGEVLTGIRASVQRHNLPVENLSASEARSRFPAFHMPDECGAVLEHRAGYLRVEACVVAHLAAARHAGAEIHSGETVATWRVEGKGVLVETNQGAYRADHLVIATGPWAAAMLAELRLPLDVVRKPQYWFATDNPAYHVDAGLPAFLYELRRGIFYGFPRMDDQGVKVAQHSGGSMVNDPANVDRQIHALDLHAVEQFVVDHLSGVTQRLLRHSVCMYTMTPDGHFIVDRHPDHPHVAFVAGLSGHGFKFT